MIVSAHRNKEISRGFTLIELLVVIAIIGILSSIVLASLNTARAKGRDARRIADIKQIQLALELYYDANSAYPASIGVAGSSPLVSGGFIAALPMDPSQPINPYAYTPYEVSGSTICTSYHLGASLETQNSALNNNAGLTAPPSGFALCGGATSDFSGLSTTPCKSGDTGTKCYDVRP